MANNNFRNASKFYWVFFFLLIFILLAAPFFFSRSKVTKNPAEFRTQEKNYVTIEGTAWGISPSVFPLIAAGDFQVDHNGEENVRVISIVRSKPSLMCKASFDEGKSYVDFITSARDVDLILKVRCDAAGDTLVLHPTTSDLTVGKTFGVTFYDKNKTRNYYLNIEISKVNKPR